jgi:hypothetical protein
MGFFAAASSGDDAAPIENFASRFQDDLAALTDAAGHYTIRNIFFGTYPKGSASKPGFDADEVTITIAARTTTQNFSLRRDWASLGGGGTVTAFNGPDFTAFGCGPTSAIDQSLGNCWGSTSDLDAGGVAVPKFVTVKLPQAVNISEFAIDPGETCGDDATAATKDFRVETSTDAPPSRWRPPAPSARPTPTASTRSPLTPAPAPGSPSSASP